MCLEPQSIVSRSTAGMSCETCRAAAELSLGTVAMAWATSDTPGAYVRMDSKKRMDAFDVHGGIHTG